MPIETTNVFSAPIFKESREAILKIINNFSSWRHADSDKQTGLGKVEDF